MIDEVKDFYDHGESNIVYVKENIILKEFENENEQFSHGCTCKSFCTEEGAICECIQKFGKNYIKISCENKSTANIYTLNDERVNLFSHKYFLKDNSLPIYECNTNCNCGFECSNRLVQYGPRKNLKVIKCDAKGLGLITEEFIHRGMFICEYAGEVITKQIADVRYEENRKNGRMNYILEFNEHFGDVKLRTIIDPSMYGNIGRYLNHSCEPNCSLISVRVNEFIPKLCIFSIVDIQPFDELTFDYGEHVTKYDENQELTKCLCKKSKCRKLLPFI